jgi:hypothetical protein
MTTPYNNVVITAKIDIYLLTCVKVKCPRYTGLGVAQRVSGQQHTPAVLYPQERPIVQEAGWAPGPV